MKCDGCNALQQNCFVSCLDCFVVATQQCITVVVLLWHHSNARQHASNSKGNIYASNGHMYTSAHAFTFISSSRYLHVFFSIQDMAIHVCAYRLYIYQHTAIQVSTSIHDKTIKANVHVYMIFLRVFAYSSAFIRGQHTTIIDSSGRSGPRIYCDYVH